MRKKFTTVFLGLLAAFLISSCGSEDPVVPEPIPEVTPVPTPTPVPGNCGTANMDGHWEGHISYETRNNLTGYEDSLELNHQRWIAWSTNCSASLDGLAMQALDELIVVDSGPVKRFRRIGGTREDTFKGECTFISECEDCDPVPDVCDIEITRKKTDFNGDIIEDVEWKYVFSDMKLTTATQNPPDPPGGGSGGGGGDGGSHAMKNFTPLRDLVNDFNRGE